MQKIVSYDASLKNIQLASTRDLKNTLRLFNEATSFIAEVIYNEWSSVEMISTLKYKEHFVESLIHQTKDNPTPKYVLFDKLFYKFPSYLRRNAIDEAIGSISFYYSNLKNYEAERYIAISSGKKFKKKAPKLTFNLNKYPTLFKKNMFNKLNRNHFEIKVYKNKDWVWLPVQLREQDLQYIEEHCSGLKALSPSLKRKNNKYYLSFPFKKNVDFDTKKPINEQTVLAVDLGINTQATCSILRGDGTIVARHFIKLATETDRMHRLLNRLKEVQQQSGNAKLKKIWSKINGYKQELTNKMVHEIFEFALKYKVDVIVLENLSAHMGRTCKSKRDKIHHWNKRTIIDKIKTKAHFYGIRYALVCPKNTSALAFDGSGFVKRDKNNYSLATFTTGKRYNADLSASYNIGARYFIREHQKAILETEWSLLEAKVPGLERRTLSTLATFRSLLKALCTPAVA